VARHLHIDAVREAGWTWISGSAVTMRARGSTSRTASMAATEARTSWSFNSPDRPRSHGFMIASSPPAQAKKLISLTGVQNGTASVVSRWTCAAARAKRAKRSTNAALQMSMPSGQP
jgi:hypothetical protein